MYRSFYVADFDNYSNESFKDFDNYSNESFKDFDNYSNESFKDFNNCINEFFKDFDNYSNESCKESDDCINNKETISVDKILKKHFPNFKCDIFLSHAHKDIEKVVNLAIFLEKKYDCKVFVDSIFWENIYDILKKIDDDYCSIGNNTYDYDKRNFTTSNLFLILNAALHKMIEKSYYFFFLETKQSIDENKKLISPWIFSELSFATQVKQGDEPKPENKLYSIEKFFSEKNICSEKLEEDLNKLEFSFLTPELNHILSYEEFLKLINDN